MNPFSGVVILLAWILVGCAAGGTYLAHDRNIAFAMLVVVTAVLTGVIQGADRAERECHQRHKRPTPQQPSSGSLRGTREKGQP